MTQSRPRPARPPYEMVDRLVALAMEPIYFCPIMEEEIPGPKANLRAHLRDDHTREEVEMYLRTWDPDYEPPHGLDWQVQVSGALIKLRLPGEAIMQKIQQHPNAVPNYTNYATVKNKLAVRLEEVMSDLLADQDWLPLTGISETSRGEVIEPSGNDSEEGAEPSG